MSEDYKNVLEKIELIRNNIHKIVDDANDIQKYKLKYLDFQEDYYNWAKNLPEEQKKLFSNIHNTGSIYNSISSPMEIIFGFELPYRINQSGAYDRNWVQQKDEKYDKWAP